MKAIEFIKELPFKPQSREGKGCGEPSNSELKRWLNTSSVVINGVCPKPGDEVSRPITELIFFPKGNRVTMVKEV